MYLFTPHVWGGISGVIPACEGMRCHIEVSDLHLGQNMPLNLAIGHTQVRKALEGKAVSFIKSDVMCLSSGLRDEAHLLALMSSHTVAAQCSPCTPSSQGPIQSL